MNYIFNNMYIKTLKFEHFKEYSHFIESLNNSNILHLEEMFGSYYCYIFYHSLTNKIEKIITFCSDYSEDNLFVIYSNEYQLLILYTGNKLFFVDNELQIIASIDIPTPLIGLFMTKGNNLLVLEEISCRLLNSTGDILSEKTFDFIDDFNIINNELVIDANNDKFYIDLIK